MSQIISIDSTTENPSSHASIILNLNFTFNFLAINPTAYLH